MPTSWPAGGYLCVGHDYHAREVETFGSPLMDANANREMFEAGVEVLSKAFVGKPFSHKYWTIPPGQPPFAKIGGYSR